MLNYILIPYLFSLIMKCGFHSTNYCFHSTKCGFHSTNGFSLPQDVNNWLVVNNAYG